MANKSFMALAAVITSLVLWPSKAMAHCPLCTMAVGTGLVAARAMGIDDSVVGIWVGAFIISTALWLDRFLVKRKKTFPMHKAAIITAFFMLTVVPFYFSSLINFQRTLFGIDRLLFGTVAGSALTLFSFSLSKRVRDSDDRPFMPFQAIIVTIAILVISNLALTLMVA